jgi:hypothetical protein
MFVCAGEGQCFRAGVLGFVIVSNAPRAGAIDELPDLYRSISPNRSAYTSQSFSPPGRSPTVGFSSPTCRKAAARQRCFTRRLRCCELANASLRDSGVGNVFTSLRNQRGATHIQESGPVGPTAPPRQISADLLASAATVRFWPPPLFVILRHIISH